MARKGQFKKGGGRVGDGRGRKRSRSCAPTSRALTIVEKPQVKVIRVPTSAIATRRKGSAPSRRRASSGTIIARAHGAGEFIPGPFRMRSAAISGALGFADAGKGLTGLKDLLDKIPTHGKVPKELLVGLALNYFADRGDWVDAGAQAFIDVGAFKFGQAGFTMSGDEDDF